MSGSMSRFLRHCYAIVWFFGGFTLEMLGTPLSLLRLIIYWRPRLSTEPMKNVIRRLCEANANCHLQPFAYQCTLPEDNIRLLRLQEWKGGVLHCTLQSFALDDCPAYTALSYTWADSSYSIFLLFLDVVKRVYEILHRSWNIIKAYEHPLYSAVGPGVSIQLLSDPLASSPKPAQKRRLIICNGQAMFVTQNLFDALELIPSANECTEIYWWVDQICINQSNTVEKDVHVPLMGRIYSRATGVAAWLGRPAKYEEYTLETAIQFSRTGPFVVSPRAKTFWWSQAPSRWSLDALFHRAWFRRIWIVQEVIFAKRLTFFLGRKSIGSADLVAAARRMKDFEGATALWLYSVPTQALIEVYDARESYNAEQGWTLEEWIQISRGRQASDSRDLLFAGLSLLSKTERSRISVNYSSTYKEVRSYVTRHVLLDGKGPEALCFAERGPYSKYWLSQKQPSWECNIQQEIGHTHLKHSNYMADAKRDPSKTALRVSDCDGTLHVVAAKIDKIEFVCETLAIRDNPQLEQFVDAILNLGSEYSWTNEHPLTATARTFTANRCSTLGLNAEYATERFVAMIATLLSGTGVGLLQKNHPNIDLSIIDEWFRRISCHHEPLERLKTAFPTFAWDQPWDYFYGATKWEEFAKRPMLVVDKAPPADDAYIPLMVSATQGRSFFRTEKGFIGLGPPNALPGDEVVILQGSRVPHILSRKNYRRNPLTTDDNSPAKDLYHLLRDTIMKTTQNPGNAEHTLPKNNSVDRSDILYQVIDQMWSSMCGARVFEGETYVHGLMNGELAKMLEEGSVSWEEMVIE